MVASEDREFPTFPRGSIREEILASFRNFLRESFDENGEPYLEADIQAATSDLSRYWSEADALDLSLMAAQQRAQWLADQAHPETASDKWLESHHASLWPVGPPLPASSGGGPFTWKATPGTVFVGSTTRPDPTAHKFKSGASTFQVLYTVVTPPNGIATLVGRALETGFGTNIAAGAVCVPAFAPSGATPEGITVLENFSGGAPQENSRDYAKRILDEIRHRQAAGNNPQIRAWTREATGAVEDGFVYACALHANSIVICVLQKRGSTLGPAARIAGSTVLGDVIASLVPPGSGVVPACPHVLVLTGVERRVHTMVRLTMRKASTSGWSDAVPWPACSSSVATITTVTNQTDIRVTVPGGTPLPAVATPAVMVWNESTSRFAVLSVSSWTDLGSNVVRLQLSQAPENITLAVGQYVSPGNALHVSIAKGAEAYHDSLGPGEVVDLATSILAHRAFRFPPPEEEWPQTAGSNILTFIREQLGGATSNEQLVSQSVTVPSVPTDPADGPELLTLGKFGVYPA